MAFIVAYYSLLQYTEDLTCVDDGKGRVTCADCRCEYHLSYNWQSRMVESRDELRKSTLRCPEANDEGQMLRLRRGDRSSVCAKGGQARVL